MPRKPGPTPWAVAAPSTSPSANTRTARAHLCPHHGSSRTTDECPSSRQTHPSTVASRGSPLTSSWTSKGTSLRSRLTSGNRRHARHASDDGRTIGTGREKGVGRIKRVAAVFTFGAAESLCRVGDKGHRLTTSPADLRWMSLSATLGRLPASYQRIPTFAARKS